MEEKPASKILFDDLGIATVLKKGFLKVPPYQREYAWNDENVEKLFEDIAGALADRSPYYFLGTIVLTMAGSQPEIVDGQQRLATTSILLAAMRDYAIEKGDARLTQHIETFLLEYDPDLKDDVPRLTLNIDDNMFFKKRIIYRPDNAERQTIKPKLDSHKLLEEAAIIAADRVRIIVQGQPDPAKRINDWLKYLTSNAILIQLTTPSAMNAFKMFETLNDRGVPTTQADMLKSYLFREAGKENLEIVQPKWTRMRSSLESLGINDVILTYLRHFTHVYLGLSEERERPSIFDRLSAKVKGSGMSLKFIDVLADYADDYAAILNPTHSKWNHYPNSVYESLTVMRELNVSQIRPLMLAVAHHFSEKEADKAFRAFISWTVRFLISGGMRGQKLEDAYAEQSHRIFKGEISTTQELFDGMKDKILPNDKQFEESFATKTVSVEKLARYYLRSIEAYDIDEYKYPELMPIKDTTRMSLEHILPEDPDPIGWAYISKEDASAYYKRIGNLTLLNTQQNGALNNAKFSIKREAFCDSVLKLNRDICENTEPDTKWSIEHIVERQKELAKKAVKVWTLMPSK